MIVFQRLGQNRRLFGNFFRHEMLMMALAGAGDTQINLLARTFHRVAVFIQNTHTRTGDNGHVAFGQIGDFVGHIRKRQSVRANEHLTLAPANRQW